MPLVRKRGSALESNSSTEPARVKVARLGRPHGLEGFLGLYVDPSDLVHFETGSTVYVADHVLTVRSVRRGAKGHEVSFIEIADRGDAEDIRNQDVLVTDRRALAENEYWPGDLIGLSVRPGGGEVVDVIYGAAQDRLVIERNGERFEVPFVDELVPVVDLDGGEVEIREIEGLS